jgi:tetratricopeptide (TPR) repeat protein
LGKSSLAPLPVFRSLYRIVLAQKKIEKPAVGVPRAKPYDIIVKEGKDLLEDEYYSRAALEFSVALREKPTDIEIYKLLAEAHLRAGEYEKLGNLITKIHETFPDSELAVILATRQLIEEQKFTEALAILKNKNPLPDELKFYQAMLLSLQNDHDGAREILKNLETTTTISPETQLKVNAFVTLYQEFSELSDGKNPHLFTLIAKKLAEFHEATLALAFADTAIREDITYVDAWIIRGYASFLKQDYESALKDLRHAYELDTIRPETHYFLALALLKTNNSPEAALFLEKSLDHNFAFENDVRWKLIEIYSAQQKFDKVIELYKNTAKLDPIPEKFIPAVHTAVDLLKKPELALEITSSLLAKNEGNILAMNLHAWALIANKEFTEAETLLAATLKLDEKNARTFLNLGLLAESQGDLQKAKNYYKKSYELGKDDPADAVVNLAAEKYNELLERTEKR